MVYPWNKSVEEASGETGSIFDELEIGKDCVNAQFNRVRVCPQFMNVKPLEQFSVFSMKPINNAES